MEERVIQSLKLSTFRRLYSLGAFEIHDFDIQKLVGWSENDFQQKSIHALNRLAGDFLKELYEDHLQDHKIHFYENNSQLIIDFLSKENSIVFSITITDSPTMKGEHIYVYQGSHLSKVFQTKLEALTYLNT